MKTKDYIGTAIVLIAVVVVGLNWRGAIKLCYYATPWGQEELFRRRVIAAGYGDPAPWEGKLDGIEPLERWRRANQ